MASDRDTWSDARPLLEGAGFVEGRAGYERFVMDRDGAHAQYLGQTGPHGSWYGGIERDGRRRDLRGPRRGLRLFKTAGACLEALEREVRPMALEGPYCAKHAAEIVQNMR